MADKILASDLSFLELLQPKCINEFTIKLQKSISDQNASRKCYLGFFFSQRNKSHPEFHHSWNVPYDEKVIILCYFGEVGLSCDKFVALTIRKCQKMRANSSASLPILTSSSNCLASLSAVSFLNLDISAFNSEFAFFRSRISDPISSSIRASCLTKKSVYSTSY